MHFIKLMYPKKLDVCWSLIDVTALRNRNDRKKKKKIGRANVFIRHRAWHAFLHRRGGGNSRSALRGCWMLHDGWEMTDRGQPPGESIFLQRAVLYPDRKRKKKDKESINSPPFPPLWCITVQRALHTDCTALTLLLPPTQPIEVAHREEHSWKLNAAERLVGNASFSVIYFLSSGCLYNPNSLKADGEDSCAFGIFCIGGLQMQLMMGMK